VAERTDFEEYPHSYLKAGDWWMWNSSYDGNAWEDIGEDCYSNNIRNWAYQIRTVNATNVSQTIYQNSGERTGSSGHTVYNCLEIDQSLDEGMSDTGRGTHRAVFTGNSLAIQALNNMRDATVYTSPTDATLMYHLNSLTYPDATSGTCPTDNWYTHNSDTTNHQADKYGYPFALGDSLNTHEYYWARPNIGGDQNVERDWNTRVVTYVHDYNVSNQSNQILNSFAYDHDGNPSNAIYDVWVSDQYQTSNSFSGDELTPESGSRIHYYSPEVKNDVRWVDAYQYIGTEEFVIQAYEVGTYEVVNTSVTFAANTLVSANITNTDCEHGKYINLLCLVIDTDYQGDAGEYYPNGRTVYPNMMSPDSGTWPFYNAIKHVWFNASETKQVDWSTGYDTSSGTAWAVWCQGEYTHK